MKSLDEVLNYTNEELVYRFSSDFGVDPKDAEDIFTETKRWLWLCGRQIELFQTQKKAPLMIPLLSEVNAVDLMWHTFLLFSRDYAEFCEKYFGFFIHHAPQTRADQQAWSAQVSADPNKARAIRRESLREVYEFIHDELGADVLMRWCEEYPVRFPALAGR